jgi:hypothetical protein
MTQVISWVHLQEEEHELIAYLGKSGNVWAFAWNTDPTAPEFPAAPVRDFFAEHGAALTLAYERTSARWQEENAAYWADPGARRPNRNDWGDPKNQVYIGLQDAVVAPRVREFERLEGGTVEPTDQPGVGRIVGAAPVRRRALDAKNELLRYSRGAWLEHAQAFDHQNLSYESTGASDAFQLLGKRAFGWLRRWTQESIRVSGANYARRATKRAAAAARAGAKFL